MGKAIAKGAKKAIGGYLKGTQKLADKIEEKFPRSSGSGRRGSGGRRGGRGRRGGGSRK